MTSTRERLLGRKLPETTVSIRVSDPDDLDAALAALAEAEKADPVDPEAVRLAQAAVDDCYVTITVRALPSEVHDELISAHPPLEGKDAPWNPTTYLPALLGATCTDPELDEKFWAEFGQQSATGSELLTVFYATEALHRRSPDVRVGKDSTGTRS